jgi:hypothetical protein
MWPHQSITSSLGNDILVLQNERERHLTQSKLPTSQIFAQPHSARTHTLPVGDVPGAHVLIPSSGQQ